MLLYLEGMKKGTYLYPIIIEPCEEGGFFAKCSTLQGVHAQGETYAETLKNIESVIRAVAEEGSAPALEMHRTEDTVPAFQLMLPVLQ